MNNKSFVVEYVIKAREMYSKAALKSARATEKMRESVNRAKVAFGHMVSKMVAGSRKMTAAINKAKTEVRAAASKMKQSFEDWDKGAGGTISKIRDKALIGTATITLPFLLAANSMKNAARDAGETESKFGVVYRNVIKQANAATEGLIKNYGMARDEAQRMLSDTGDLLSGFGFSQETALDISNQVQKLAVDLASFTNIEGGAARASEALTKALLGEREMVKALGIAILEKDVMAKVSTLVSQGHRFETLRQAKAYATLVLATEQSKNAIGDYARTRAELANQEREANAAFRNMWVSFGAILIPVFAKITELKKRFYTFMDGLSPKAKKIILIIGAIIATIAPLIVVITTVILAAVAMKFAFMFAGAVIVGALAPLLPLIAAIAAGGFAIYLAWDKIKQFFSGFNSSFWASASEGLNNMTESLKRLAAVVSNLFGGSSETSQAINQMAIDWQFVGSIVGDVVGTAFHNVAETISYVINLATELIELLTTFDLSNFNLELPNWKLPEFMGGGSMRDVESAALGAYHAAKDKLLGFFNSSEAPETIKQPIGTMNQSRVGVDVNVGLDRGLRETTPATVSGINAVGAVGAN